MQYWNKGTVTKIHFWNKNTFTLVIDADIEPYQAGQFIRLGLNIQGKRVSALYSFANAPHPRQHFFVITLIPNGRLTPYLASLKPGDTIQVGRRAAGRFTIDETPAGKNLFMLATGTGVTPFYSMMFANAWQDKFKDAHLYHSVRTKSDITHIRNGSSQQFLDDLSQTQPANLNTDMAIKAYYRPIVTRELSLMRAQRLPDQMFKEHRDFNPDHDRFMLCGNPDFIRDTVKRLEAIGFSIISGKNPGGQIMTEAYW